VKFTKSREGIELAMSASRRWGPGNAVYDYTEQRLTTADLLSSFHRKWIGARPTNPKETP
jgi:hypothetical protein